MKNISLTDAECELLSVAIARLASRAVICRLFKLSDEELRLVVARQLPTLAKKLQQCPLQYPSKGTSHSNEVYPPFLWKFRR